MARSKKDQNTAPPADPSAEQNPKDPDTKSDTKPETKPAGKTGARTFYSKFRGYLLFNEVQFVNGRAQVSDPALIKRMEADPKYGVDFFPE